MLLYIRAAHEEQKTEKNRKNITILIQRFIKPLCILMIIIATFFNEWSNLLFVKLHDIVSKKMASEEK